MNKIDKTKELLENSEKLSKESEDGKIRRMGLTDKDNKESNKLL